MTDPTRTPQNVPDVDEKPPQPQTSGSEVLDTFRDSSAGISVQTWGERSEEEREAFMSQVEAVYLSVLDEFFEESNSCVNIVQASTRSHGRWRHLLIILTGGLAILNLLAAYKWPADAGV